jgi:hypothetical protein
MASGDRNYDLATETTQQKILKNIGSSGGAILVESKITPKNGVVFELNGSGKVYYFDVSAHFNSKTTGTLKIEVDGELIANYEYVNDNSNYTGSIAYRGLNLNHIISDGSNSIIQFYDSYKSSLKIPTGSVENSTTYLGVNPTSELKSVSYSNIQNYQLNLVINDYIQFNNSFKITVSNQGSTSAKSGIAYIMNEVTK